MSKTKFSAEELNEQLIIIVNHLRTLNIKNWFIAYGTLLGHIRDNRCVNNDDDVDIIIDKTNYDAIYKLIKDNKYIIKIEDDDKNFLQINTKENMPPIDFYFADCDNSGNYYDKWDKLNWLNCHPLQKRQFNNVILNLPNNYESKLTLLYGDWRIPSDTKGKKINEIEYKYKKYKTKYLKLKNK